MKLARAVACTGAAAVMAALSGCASDPQSDAISNVVTKMSDATGDIESIAKALGVPMAELMPDRPPAPSGS